jgi:hypothetical protein
MSFVVLYEKSEDAQEYSEAINQKRTDNTMAKRKRIKRQKTIYKTIHKKLNIEQHKLLKNLG